MTGQFQRLSLAFTAAFLAVTLATGFWGLVRQQALFQRGDNPRRILSERRQARGAILDRNGQALAESIGEPGELVRHYPYPSLAPVLGYVSAQYGRAGLEAALDPLLHGDQGYDALELNWRATVLGALPAGRAARLSLDLSLQRAADSALGDHAGAIVLLDSVSGEILAMASHPTYDSNQLDADWSNLVSDPRSPLLNRAAQGLYQPGGAIWPVVAAGALAARQAGADEVFPSAAETVTVGGQAVSCGRTPPSPDLTLGQALQFGCARPFETLGERLGRDQLQKLFSAFRLYTPPAIELQTAAASGDVADAAAAALGQGAVNVTPLHVALIVAALAEHGTLPAPQLVLATEARDGQWQPAAQAEGPMSSIPADVADQVKAMLADGYVASAYAGHEGKTVAWFMGFTPSDAPRFALAVLLEDGDLTAAEAMGREVLAAAIQR